MRTRHRVILSAASFFALALAGSACSSSSDAEGATPFTGTTGAELYAQACAQCHGVELRGTDQGPPFLDRIYEPGHHPDAAFMAAAMAGARAHHWDFGNMPRVEGITEAQVTAIVSYVREQQRAHGIN